MSNILLLLALFIILGIQQSQAEDGCFLGSHTSYMKWVETDGSLAFPEYRNKFVITKDSYEGAEEYDQQWNRLNDSSSCLIDEVNNILKCVGRYVENLPSPENINIGYIKTYIVSFASLGPLPPSNFNGLNISDLIILNSSLTYISDDVFENIASLNTLTINGNNIETLNNIDNVFKNLSSIKAVFLEANQLRNLNCINNKSTILENLELLSLAHNQLGLVNFQCLSKSKLIYLNLKGVYIDHHQAQSMKFSTLPKTLTTVDLSFSNISSEALKTVLYMLNSHNITTLSLAELGLVAIPFDALTYLRNSLNYLSLSGNWFKDNSFYTRMESSGVAFLQLQELDLRNCEIEAIDSIMLTYFPNLQKLTLSGNMLHAVESSLLTFSPFLEYLDLSNNIETLTFLYVINKPTKKLKLNTSTSALKVLNLSNNIFNSSQNWYMYNMTLQLLTKLEILSLCSSTLNARNIDALSVFRNLTMLDLSCTLKNDSDHVLMDALQNLFLYLYSLEELQFVDNSYYFSQDSVNMFSSLNSLTTLNLTGNSITSLFEKIFYNLSNLEVLILNKNYIVPWSSKIFCETNQIQNLDLSNNQITFITENMEKEFKNLKILNLKNNRLVCNKRTNDIVCGVKNNHTELTLVDWQEYTCLDLSQNENLSYKNSSLCSESKTFPSDGDDVDNVGGNYVKDNNIISIVLIPISVITVIILGVVTKMNWWHIRHYIIRAKQSSTHYLLGKGNSDVNNHTFVYDVFISYSDIDRSWVLDHLIPFIERENSMRVCFHERDFQVGLSILENIVESMAKSRCLLMVISESFVKSRWCQFEMHLAQHHAVETEKEQLVMVLMENIAKQNRSKTLHHLMSTRTYLIWPKQQSKEDSIELFWKRLHRAIRYNCNDTRISITS